MTIRHYQIFAAVCGEMNMTAAAGHLNMTQPAVSQTIAELEEYYGVRLFERLSRKLYLTGAGEKLLGYARHILRMNADAEGEMRTLNRSAALRLGVSVTVGTYVLPGLAAAYREKAPWVTLRVTEDNTAQIEKMIMEDRLDLGFVEGEVTLRDIVTRPFREDGMTLICGRDHPFAKRKSVEPRELEGENFILREEGSGTRKSFEDVMREHALRWSSTWTCNNADTIKMAVARGLGISVISRLAVQKELDAGELAGVDIEGLRFTRLFQFIYHKDKYHTEAMRDFMDFCCGVCG